MIGESPNRMEHAPFSPLLSAFIRDHLGSVRTVTDRWGSVEEDQSALGTVALPYLDFGARMYDPKLVRWNTYDPLARKTYGINPYG